MTDIKLGKYKHYKNDHYYDVFGIAHHVETQEKTVLYRPLYEIPELEAKYPNGVIFARAVDIFTEKVKIDDKEVSRFEYVGNLS